MAFDPTAPALALIIEPTDDVATLRPVAVNVSGRIAEIIEGTIEAIELDGGSVLWLDESGKNLGLPTNLLATKIAHRLHAGLFPDDTINGRALIVGEGQGPMETSSASTSLLQPWTPSDAQMSKSCRAESLRPNIRGHVRSPSVAYRADDRLRDVARSLMLPESEDQPSLLTQSFGGFEVALAVRRDLLVPSSSRSLSRRCGGPGSRARSTRR